MGSIVSLNLSCASLFGYTKAELLNQNVSILMPSLFANYHDEILKRYAETSETSAYLHKDK